MMDCPRSAVVAEIAESDTASTAQADTAVASLVPASWAADCKSAADTHKAVVRTSFILLFPVEQRDFFTGIPAIEILSVLYTHDVA